jgi:hypothetical protein
MKIGHTRALVHAALAAALDHVPTIPTRGSASPYRQRRPDVLAKVRAAGPTGMSHPKKSLTLV